MHREKLGEITHVGAVMEGCATIGEFMKEWTQIHKDVGWSPDTVVYTVRFHLARIGEKDIRNPTFVGIPILDRQVSR